MSEYEKIIGDILDVAQKNVVSISSLSTQVGIINSTIAGHSLAIESLTDRIKSFEDNERLTRTQCTFIRNSIHRRVRKLLNIECDENGRPIDRCILKDKLYSGAFISRCYCDAKSKGLMAQTYTETPKKNYDACVEFVNNWIPSGGTLSYIEYLDKRRAA